MNNGRLLSWARWIASLLVLLGNHATAQSDLPIFTDHLVNGFQDWSWAPRSLANSSPTHSGQASIRVTAGPWQGLAFHHSEFLTTPYTNLVFWAHGGTTGGQRLTLAAVVGGTTLSPVQLPILTANTWTQITVPLARLKAVQEPHFEGFTLVLQGGGPSGVFYLDDLTLTASPMDTRVAVTVDAGHPLRPVDRRWLGVNTAIWDKELALPPTIPLLKSLGATLLRFPGGSLSDEYHWASNRSLSNTWQWATSFHQFAPVARAVGADVIITVNYGTGTPAEAAAWVRDANITNNLGIHFWEVGNENYGTWETDATDHPHDPYTYAQRAKDYFAAMKAADPSIRIGVVVSDGETNYSNGYTQHSVINPRTGKTVDGWTPVVLSNLKHLGIVPDFLIYHFYPEYTGEESDPLLLQVSSKWTALAADLRQQVRDYYGAGGDGIEILVTENNSNAGDPGRQSTSLVNGLYLADSLGQLMQTEFNSFIWWDLRNGPDLKGSMDPTLYGWRTNGDMGLIDTTVHPYPTYYAMKLMHEFLSRGGSVVPAVTSNPLLAAYSVRDTNGVLQLMLINKSPTNTLHAEFELRGFSPLSRAQLTSYGILQDESARTHLGSPDLATNIVTGIGYPWLLDVPPYSLNWLSIPASAPVLAWASLVSNPGGTLEIEIRGADGESYVLEKSSDLRSWSSETTNRLASPGGVNQEKVPFSGHVTYWRAQYLLSP